MRHRLIGKRDGKRLLALVMVTSLVIGLAILAFASENGAGDAETVSIAEYVEESLSESIVEDEYSGETFF